MCDRINKALRSVLLPKKHPSTIPLLVEFRLRRLLTAVSISGPQLLNYKKRLVDMCEHHLAAPPPPESDQQQIIDDNDEHDKVSPYSSGDWESEGVFFSLT